MSAHEPAQPGTMRVHASTVCHAGRGLLILGRSGAGKSGLALQLMALGAQLVADDQTELRAERGALLATCPPAIAGMIEARGMGLLRVPCAGEVPLALAVSLDTPQEARLPQTQHIRFLGVALPLFCRVDAPYFPAALLLSLEHGPHTQDD